MLCGASRGVTRVLHQIRLSLLHDQPHPPSQNIVLGALRNPDAFCTPLALPWYSRTAVPSDLNNQYLQSFLRDPLEIVIDAAY